jgi:hypothetical protein
MYENISLNSSTMRNISNKTCKENQNTNFVLHGVFPKIVPFMRWSRKIWLRLRMTIWRHGACWINKATRAQSHARTRTPITTHTHRNMQQWFRERATVLRYRYVISCAFQPYCCLQCTGCHTAVIWLYRNSIQEQVCESESEVGRGVGWRVGGGISLL